MPICIYAPLADVLAVCGFPDLPGYGNSFAGFRGRRGLIQRRFAHGRRYLYDAAVLDLHPAEGIVNGVHELQLILARDNLFHSAFEREEDAKAIGGEIIRQRGVYTYWH